MNVIIHVNVKFFFRGGLWSHGGVFLVAENFACTLNTCVDLDSEVGQCSSDSADFGLAIGKGSSLSDFFFFL